MMTLKLINYIMDNFFLLNNNIYATTDPMQKLENFLNLNIYFFVSTKISSKQKYKLTISSKTRNSLSMHVIAMQRILVVQIVFMFYESYRQNYVLLRFLFVFSELISK